MDESKMIKNLLDYFRPHVGRSTASRADALIRQSLQKFSRYLERESSSGVFLEFMFSVIEVFRCKDFYSIRNCLEEFVARRLMNVFMTQEPHILDRFPILRRYSTAKDAKKNIQGFLPGMKLILSSYMILTFVSNDVKVLRRMMRYGVQYRLDESDMRRFLGTMTWNHLQGMRPDEWSLDEQMEVISLTVTHYKTRDQLRRLFFVLHAIEIVRQKRNTNESPQSTIDILDLLFQSIKDPRISVTEISQVLSIVLKSEHNEREIREVCSEFVEEYPASVQPLQPRSLKHLSRCQVRESLTEAKTLPHGVWDLPLPRELQNYVLLQKTEDEFYPEYVSALLDESPSRRSVRRSERLELLRTARDRQPE